MNETHYLLDNNVLSKLTPFQRLGAFVQQRCRITSDVLHEARGLPDARRLAPLEYPITPDVLPRVKQVMATVPPNDTSLVDLYSNKGSADPGLIAVALYEASVGQESLWSDKWIIVTDDSAVRSKAQEFGIETKSAHEFIALVDDTA